MTEHPASEDHPVSEPVRLPGVGQRLDLVDEDGRPVTVIRRKDGTVELHHEADVTILTPSQARALGALASGHFRMAPEMFDRAAGVLGGIDFDWVTIGVEAWSAGRSIEELALRRRLGTTIVAILRGSIPIVITDPSQRLEVGDELIVVSPPDVRSDLERFLQRGP